jgi:catechol 2,3-dioxygenase-like lactoylglutathione lyase family enzyme
MNESNRRTRAVAFVADDNLAMHVTDMEKAEKFYSDVLGFRLLKRTNDRLVYHTGKITLYVVKNTKVMPFIRALGVRSYEKAKQHLTRNGCKISREWPEDRALYFEDPFGITLDIVEKES